MTTRPGDGDTADGSVGAWKRLIALVALPRSGTTVTTALLGAHSDVHEVYEPWNANAGSLDAGQPMSYAEFVQRFAPPQLDRSTLLVKETMTSAKYLNRLVQILAEAPSTVEKTMIILLRNPFHVFLSECEARRRWWGATDLVADLATFTEWSTRTLQSYRKLTAAAEPFDALCVSYEALVTDPDVSTQLMTTLGLPPQDRRDNYFEHVDLGRVRGDINVAEDAQALHTRSIASRQEQYEAMRSTLREAPQFVQIRQISHQIARMNPITRLSAVKPLMRVLNGRPPGGLGKQGGERRPAHGPAQNRVRS